MYEKLFLMIIVIASMSFSIAWGTEQIPITISDKMDKVVFDGKWTNSTEWKRSTEDRIIDSETNHRMQLKTAHQDNFVYILIDFVSDENPEKEKDFSIICFDTNNDKQDAIDENDFCFKTFLDGDSIILQGSENKFQQITNDEFLSAGTASDENDRYSKIPHSSYEYRFPTDLIGRSNIYGLFIGAYDSNTDSMITWPTEINITDPTTIPPSSQWGEIYSPDNSIPEFDLPLLILLPMFAVIIYLTKKFSQSNKYEKKLTA